MNSSQIFAKENKYHWFFEHILIPFLAKMKQLEVQGIIMPDMSLEEQDEFVTLAEKYDRSFIQLVTLKFG